MGQQILQSIVDGFVAAGLSIAYVLLPPTMMLFLLKSFVPIIGNPLWQAYCKVIAWVILLPIHAIQFLIREASGRRRH